MTQLEHSRAETHQTVEFDQRPLAADDREWMEGMGIGWSDDPEWLEALNDLAAIGDVRIRPDSDEPTVRAIVAARRDFLSCMTRVAPQTLDTLQAAKRSLMPTGTVIGTQRVLAGRGIDGAVAVNAYPALFMHRPAKTQERLDLIDTLELDTSAVVEKFPSILGYNTDTLRHKFDAIRTLGADVGRVLQNYPRILMVTDEQFAVRVTALRRHGLDVGEAVDTLPSILTYLPETIDRKITELRELGLKPAAYTHNSRLFAYATDSVKEKIALYDQLGFDGAALVNKMPDAANYSASTIRSKIDNIERSGLRAAVVIAKNPRVLYLSESTLTHKMEYLNGLGITAAAIERGSGILNIGEQNVRDTYEGMLDMGLDMPAVVNSQPTLLHLGLANIAQKLASLDSLGFDAVTLANKNPSILCLTPDTVTEKVRICVAAARAWGWDDPGGRVTQLITEWPTLLTYSPAKLRTTVRLANDALAPIDADAVRGTDVAAMMTMNLEQAVMAYVDQPGEITRPRDVRQLTQSYRDIGKRALQDRILSATDDRVARTYARTHGF